MRNATKAKAWDNLSKHFEQKTLSRKMFYRKKLYSARMDEETNMIEHINYVKTLFEHLEAVEVKCEILNINPKLNCTALN